jgi:glycosyltransferase involved in cell wall biosynthesis
VTPATVSVIIPVFNGRPWIGQAIESVLAQTVPAREIIVVDDGSTDGSGEVARGYGERVRVIARANAGVAAARNRGMRAASGDLLAFLDADDVWLPSKLEHQGRALTRHPEIGVLGTRVFDWRGCAAGVSETAGASRVARVSRPALAVKNYLAVSSVIVRREVASATGEFDTSLRGAADHDYWIRASEHTSVAHLEARLTGYRAVPGSMSRHPQAMEADLRRILRKLDARDAWRGDRALRRRAHSYADFSCAYMYGAAGRQRDAVIRMLRSLARYPLPYARREGGVPLARPRRLGVLLLRMLGVMKPDPGV